MQTTKTLKMKPESTKTLLVTGGTLLFSIIFWQQKLGINTIFFDLFIILSVFYLYPVAFKKPAIKWLLAAHIITAFALLYHNTELSKLAFSVTLLLVVVFTQYLHRSVWYAAGSAFMNYLLLIPSFIGGAKQLNQNKMRLYNVRKTVRFLIIPILLSLVFYWLYNFANSIFSSIMSDASIALQHFFSQFFSWFSLEWCWFLLLGLLITGGLLLKSNVAYFSEKDIVQTKELSRKRTNLIEWKRTGMFQLLFLLMGRFSDGMLALRNENKTGIISLALLNLLLLCINCIDVTFVWFGFQYKNNMNLSAYVHEGTGMLIFSIVLAMVLLLFFFRGNLNFYKKNKWLRIGAYAWLIQNMVLVISVLLRDYYYIVHMGLAYKRIGVLIFLMLVLFGLITIFIKIQQLKTAYYLLTVNAWFAIIVLVFSSCIHWDEMIVKYNLARKNTIPLDIHFLLSLSDKALPVLEANMDVLEKSSAQTNDLNDVYLYRSGLTAKQFFERRKADFFKEQNGYNWLSWNFADAYVKSHLAKGPETAIVNH
ncbi:MAG: hypothetical protein JWR61_977 [Ferruginibacter sp.]|nr:hypothetical protein [Ferruginibacter sp.]